MVDTKVSSPPRGIHGGGATRQALGIYSRFCLGLVVGATLSRFSSLHLQKGEVEVGEGTAADVSSNSFVLLLPSQIFTEGRPPLGACLPEVGKSVNCHQWVHMNGKGANGFGCLNFRAAERPQAQPSEQRCGLSHCSSLGCQSFSLL